MNQILVVGPAWVGDMVMAQSLFMALQRRDPDTVIDVLAPDWSMPLLQRIPQVRRAIALHAGHRELAFAKRRALGRELAAVGYDQAIVLPRSFKSALVPFFAGIPRRTGYRGEWRYGVLNDIRHLDKRVLTQTVQRFVALGADGDVSAPPVVDTPRLRVDKENQRRLLDKLDLSLQRPVVAFMPGAEYGPAKRWPAGYYADIALRLLAEHNQVWLLGSEKDRAIADEVVRIAGVPLHNLCGRTRLEDVVDLLDLVCAAVTNDSGLMHVAAAVGKPLVAVYGSSTPDYTPPLSDRAAVLYDRIECSPCFERTCPKGHMRCLTHVSPDRVWTALESLLDN